MLATLGKAWNALPLIKAGLWGILILSLRPSAVTSFPLGLLAESCASYYFRWLQEIAAVVRQTLKKKKEAKVTFWPKLQNSWGDSTGNYILELKKDI